MLSFRYLLFIFPISNFLLLLFKLISSLFLISNKNRLNRFKALYINNDNQVQNKNNINDNSSKNIMNNFENLNIIKNINNSNSTNIDLTKYNFSYGKEKASSNNKIEPPINKINNINNNKYNLPEKEKILEKKDEKLDLGKIDNLLDKLNFKRENNININNKPILEEKNNIK